MAMPNALAIAGFDPSGGAGVLADARTFAAFGYRASAVITSITFQNDERAGGAVHQTAETISGQVQSLMSQFQFACVKVGMLPTREVMKEIRRIFGRKNLAAPVVDPVMVSSSGMRLMEADGLEVFLSDILPIARLVTPNIFEAEALSGMAITTGGQMREAAAIIRQRGARAVLIKGGHLGDQKSEVRHQQSGIGWEAMDVLDDEGRVTVFRGQFIPGASLRGSGCILSSAIAAGLGNGMSLEESVRGAKEFVLAKLNS